MTWVETSIEGLNALSDVTGVAALNDFELEHQNALENVQYALEDPWTFTSLSATRVQAQVNGHTITLTGSGIGPVSNANALQDAIENGLVTGQFDRLALAVGGADILVFQANGNGWSLTSGSTVISIQGALPSSFGDLFEMLDDLAELSNGGEDLNGAERAALITRMSGWDINGISITDNGNSLLDLSFTDDAASISLLGYTLSLNGTFPDDLGELAEVAFDIADAAESQSLAQNIYTDVYDSSGRWVHVWTQWDGLVLLNESPRLPAGDYFVEVQSYSGIGTYEISALVQGERFTGVRSTQQETVDADDGISTIYSLEPGTTIEANLSDNDSDWFRVTVPEGATVQVNVTPWNVLDVVSGLEFDSLTLSGAGDVEIGWVSSYDTTQLVENGTDEITYSLEGWGYDNFLPDTAIDGAHSNSVINLENMFTGSWQSTIVFGYGGNDTILGTGGYQFLAGGEGNDSLYGGDDFDTLFGGEGNDTLDGGDGHDTVFLLADQADVTLTALADGFRVSSALDGTDEVSNVEYIEFADGRMAVSDVLHIPGLTMIGDTLLGVDFNGGMHDDTLVGGRGDDHIDGGFGADSLSGGVGDDTVSGGGGKDLIKGGKGRDEMYGEDGDDVMRGQSDGDFLDGGAGNDNVKGGGGNDTLLGGDGNDFLKGGTRRDSVEGGDGNDKLFGNSFDDTLRGGAGNDRLNAGGDDDILDGGAGNDFLKGGSGADVFEFIAGDGA
ncbi:MAG: hypothetical protein N4A53_16035, partial [Pelagimonas sp.]|nr:hypothetical protein [Pelagimonas sp.]